MVREMESLNISYKVNYPKVNHNGKSQAQTYLAFN